MTAMVFMRAGGAGGAAGPAGPAEVRPHEFVPIRRPGRGGGPPFWATSAAGAGAAADCAAASTVAVLGKEMRFGGGGKASLPVAGMAGMAGMAGGGVDNASATAAAVMASAT